MFHQYSIKGSGQICELETAVVTTNEFNMTGNFYGKRIAKPKERDHSVRCEGFRPYTQVLNNISVSQLLNATVPKRQLVSASQKKQILKPHINRDSNVKSKRSPAKPTDVILTTETTHKKSPTTRQSRRDENTPTLRKVREFLRKLDEVNLTICGSRPTSMNKVCVKSSMSKTNKLNYQTLKRVSLPADDRQPPKTYSQLYLEKKTRKKSPGRS